MEITKEILKARLGEENYRKLMEIKNPKLHEFIAVFMELCNPSKVFVCSDSGEDVDFIRKEAIKNREEEKLALKGHTVHFDSYYDQARDKERTKFLVPKGKDLGPHIRSMDRDEGLKEIHDIMKGIMRGHTLYILFFCLGPANSEFSIPCVQLTDSPYVAHSEFLLYRKGYEEFKRAKSFFKFVHSEGELDEKNTSRNIDKRRIYIDLENETVYSANTQYGGNTIGLKKLAMRLAINRASREDWLTEHMFLMCVHGPNQRKTYFTGAFPSLCGKTSTSMIPGENIVGDDISYLKKINREIRAVNVEKGIFGIIMGVNSKDNPIIWKILNRPGEIIFSNVLVTREGGVHWIGKDGETPKRGRNHSGEWTKGKKDREGNEIPPSHPNARFTLDVKLLENLDTELDNPKGVRVGGIIYGGRDSDTWVSVKESFDWTHGVITMGASLESETTAATLGERGVRKYNPMANLDFLSIPVGKYIQHHLNFIKDVKSPPKIFSVNYFLKGPKGEFLNDKIDKAVWLKWMELRSQGEAEAIRTPTGLIPGYEDLRKLFKEVLRKDYSREEYNEQFKLRIPENLEKIGRITNIYKTKVRDTPAIVFKILEEQRKRLEDARKKFGDYVTPDKFS
ncbi:MAG: phosphoenolpyruvate carboxykinase (GTP) [Candidatus Aenigmarchaeota archaeon]|nr:phosphoenolpyruvate carboxykinase (GTP) [Candidatus Aenigmarchaeota archaeon]NIQ17541.1 phosphoenolpyruvate carboxykinase (GTP) [Candidatus Aenigmarchaeota archaeon]NIS73119.1 phosphoenolpyruvate carboxykinase (GTP) [Candidatus Aenigmarchaeota archaeon]